MDDRDTELNGSIGNWGATLNVKNGGIYASFNFTSDSNQAEQQVTQWNAIKLPKAITLRYIIKVS